MDHAISYLHTHYPMSSKRTLHGIGTSNLDRNTQAYINTSPIVRVHWVMARSVRKHRDVIISLLCTSQFQNRTSPHPGQSPGIWLALSSVQWAIWLKMRPARWGIWLSYQNVCQRSETKGFRNSLIQQVSRVHGSLLLSIPREFFCCCRFI